MTTLIAAVARNGVIGNQNTIPWYIPEDFRHFKEVTKGQTVIMGSKTWDSLPKRPLPGRLNIIVSRKAGGLACLGYENTIMASSIGEAEYLATLLNPEKKIFIIGGESIYRQSIDTASRLLISEVDMEPEGDTFFPAICPETWHEASRDPREGFTIVEYVKRA